MEGGSEKDEEEKEKGGLSQDGEMAEEEGRKAVGRVGPNMPTKMEQEEHAQTHCPYRSRCRQCVQARARSSPHRVGQGSRKSSEEGVGQAKVAGEAMDYLYMSKADEKASVNPLLVMADEESGSRYARAVGQKGLGDGQEMCWLIQDICAQLRAWGRAGGAGGELIVKPDGEPALLAVKWAVMKHHRGKVTPWQLANDETAEKGLIEGAGKTTREYACVFISQIEEGQLGGQQYATQDMQWGEMEERGTKD